MNGREYATLLLNEHSDKYVPHHKRHEEWRAGERKKHGNKPEFAEQTLYEYILMCVGKTSLFLPTTDDWYGTWEGGYVEACLWKNPSNLDYWTIRLGGNDDSSWSKDFIGEENAKREWRQLLASKDIRHDDLVDYYFSN